MSFLGITTNVPYMSGYDDAILIASYTVGGIWNGASSNGADYIVFGVDWVYPHGKHEWTVFSTPNGTRSFTAGLTYDTDCTVIAYGTAYYSDGSPSPQVVNGSSQNLRSHAKAAAVGTPQSASVQSSTATIYCSYNPNTAASSATVWMEYKKQSDVSWIKAPGADDVTSGYGNPTITRYLTGLDPSTVYNFRVQISRNTSNDTTLTSGVSSFTTAAPPAPVVTSVPATAVAAASATLNGSLVYNGFTGNAFFQWGTDPGLAGATTMANIPETGDASFSQGITGLTFSTTYYFRAGYTYNSGSNTVYGSILSFTTPVNPQAVAILEDHMLLFEYDRVYGAATTVFLAVVSPSGTSSDRLYNAATPFVAGDILLSKDAGATWANTGSLPTRLGTGPWFSLALTASEMSPTGSPGDDVLIAIVDQNGPAFRDAMIHIRTKIQIGQLKADASNLSNTDAIVGTGSGSGSGVRGIAGATGLDIRGILGSVVLRTGTAQAGGASSITLDAGANGNDNYYNNSIVMIVAGTGLGQSRTITGYVGTTKVATVDSSWTVNPANDSVFVIMPTDRTWFMAHAELAALPADGGPYGDKFQLIFQRFAFKITQSATVQTLYKADNTTAITSRTVSDAAGLQTVGKLV